MRIIVPYGPGGVADTTMRIIADKLTQKLGQQFIVDNRPGAGGIVAAKAAAGAAPDGYVLHLTGNGTAISTALFRQLPYDVLRDFTPITITAWFDLIIATKAGGPLQTVADILKAARANPGKLNFGTIAPGSTQNLSAELFKSVAGIDVAMVTYRTTPELVTGLMRGDVQVGFEYYAGLNAAVSGGQLKAVATTGGMRTPALPAVPTVGESGLPAYVVESWNALSGPGGMPDDLVRVPQPRRERRAEPARSEGESHAQRHGRARHHAGGDAGAHEGRHRQMGRRHREGRHRTAVSGPAHNACRHFDRHHARRQEEIHMEKPRCRITA